MLEIAATSVEAFGEVFNAVSAAGTPRFSAILASVRNDQAGALESAANRAIDGKFYVRLISALNPVLARREDLRSRLPSGLLQSMMEGDHHAVFTAEGMWDIGWSDALNRVAPRMGVIRISTLPNQFVGSGVLVGPDLLLTAAHVVSKLIDFSTDPPTALSAAKAQVEFHHPKLVDANHQPLVSKFAPGWLECCSAPCGSPPIIDAANEELANSNLDFALIRLALPIGSMIGFVNIDAAPPANDNHMIAVAGHLGGPSPKFHWGKLIRHHKRTKRLHHHANASAGVSGGPCVDIEGRMLGIHEGAIHENGVPAYNRSIYVHDIRQAISAMTPDPLASQGNVITWLPPNVSADVLGAMDILPEEAKRHPVLGRREFQDWIKAASAARDGRRLAMVAGGKGCGKSFTGALLRARCLDAADIVVSIAPEVARETNIGSLVERLAASAAGPGVAASPANVRPDAGTLRHEIIPDGLEHVASQLKRPSGMRSPLIWLFVDFGDDLGWLACDQEAWRSFLSEALKRPWLRVVLTGLSEGRQAEFRTLFSPSTDVYSEELKPLAWPQIEEFASTLIGVTMAAEQKTATLERMRQSWERRTAGSSCHERWKTAIDLLLLLRVLMADAQ